MTDEERQRTMEFILETQAQLSVNDQKHDQRLSRLERIVKLMIKAGMRARSQMREHHERFAQQMAEVAKTLNALADSQAHSNRKLDALIDIVRADRNGRSS